MQKIIPFKKEILFKNTIEEITSISMDHHLDREDYAVKGNFIVEGEYISSGKKDTFHFEIPYLGYLEDHYKVEDIELDIDDFYYEIVDKNKLSIHVDILVDKLAEKPLLEEIEPVATVKEVIPEHQEELIDRVDTKEVENVLTNDMELEEAYMTYKVYIVREGDTVSSILEKYQITEEKLRQYNVINELAIGDKLIIPNESH